MASVLERIASGDLDNQDAATLARITLDKNPNAVSQGRIH